MNLTQYFLYKLKTQMRIIDIVSQPPKQKIRLDPIDPQDINVDLSVVKQWSQENEQLLHLILDNGMATFICNYDFLFKHYIGLNFSFKKIVQIDQSARRFQNLKVLNLTANSISILEYIPCQLQELYVDFNQIQSISNIKWQELETTGNVAIPNSKASMMTMTQGNSKLESTLNKNSTNRNDKSAANKGTLNLKTLKGTTTIPAATGTISSSQTRTSSLKLLSISHNRLKDRNIQEIMNNFPELRSLNVAYNQLNDIRNFVDCVNNGLKMLKIVSAIGNPFSLLKLYYEYMTKNLDGLRMLDGQKYVKEQPVKVVAPLKVQQSAVKQPQKADTKKDAKKDAKKAGKQASKAPVVQSPKEVEQPVQPPKPKELTEDDFTRVNVKIQITNLENFSGTVYDPQLFPQQNLDLTKTQTCFWISYTFAGESQQFNSDKIPFSKVNVVQGEQNLLSFEKVVEKCLSVNLQNTKVLLQKGLLVKIHKQQPIVQTNSETGEQKVTLSQSGEIQLKTQIFGGVFVNFQQEMLKSKEKKLIQKLFKVWDVDVAENNIFQNPMPDEAKQIGRRKAKFEEKLEALKQQRLKKIQQQQQSLKGQPKKGAKDAKKVDKKPIKKDGKEAVVSDDKKVIQKCRFALQDRTYAYLGDQKLFKATESKLAIKVSIL